MRIIDRYMFRIAGNVFLATLAVLTAVLWVTQALREIDLLTAQGQTLWLFGLLTLLALPALVMVIGPIAVFIACVYTLNKLNTDNELVVVSATGAKPWQIGRPLVILGVLVTLLTGAISLVLMPESARTLRSLLTQVRADVLANLVAEGEFTSIDQGLTFYVREREPDGTLRGLLFHDQRQPDRVMTYLAERGRVLRDGEQAYLVMDNGSLHQRGPEDDEISIVSFQRYVVDLSNLTAAAQRATNTVYHPREMRLTELLSPSPDNPYFQRSPGRFRSEFHERVSSTLYPLAFVMIALAALGDPRTNREGRGNAVLLAVLVMAGLRTLGFASTNLAVTQAWAVIPMYATPLVGILIPGWLFLARRRYVTEALEKLPSIGNLVERIAARFRPTGAKHGSARSR